MSTRLPGETYQQFCDRILGRRKAMSTLVERLRTITKDGERGKDSRYYLHDGAQSTFRDLQVTGDEAVKHIIALEAENAVLKQERNALNLVVRGAHEAYDAIKAERDRLRQALRKIADFVPESSTIIARAVLSPSEAEEGG